MKRIGNSKEPTIQRMLDITSNLKEKFHKSVFIDLHTRTYSGSGDSKVTYWISISDSVVGETIDSWPELLTKYRELMNE